MDDFVQECFEELSQNTNVHFFEPFLCGFGVRVILYSQNTVENASFAFSLGTILWNVGISIL